MRTISPRRSLVDRPALLALVLGALTALGPFTMDLYLPAFPAVQAEFDATETAVQVTLTATAIGMGVGQLVVGVLSDGLGRRTPLLAATVLHVGASALIALAPTTDVVSIARFAQGFGAAGGAVVASAMARDLFGGKRLVTMAARIALVSGLAPVVAPVIGSQLLAVMPWRGVFWVLAAYGAAIVVAAVLLIPETRRAGARRVSSRALRRAVAVLFRDRMYVSAFLIGAAVFAMIITYLSAAPFIYQSRYGMSPQAFGVVFAATSAGVVIATQAAARLMRSIAPAVLLAWAFPAACATGFVLLAIGAWELPVGAFIAASFAVVAFQGFCNPCTQVLMLADHEEESGTAVAIAGFINSLLGGLLAVLPSVFGDVGPSSVGAVVLLTAALGTLVVFVGLRPSAPRRLAEA